MTSSSDAGHWAFRFKDSSNAANENKFPYIFSEEGIVYLTNDATADNAEEGSNANILSRDEATGRFNN
jgi:hypothetical protein